MAWGVLLVLGLALTGCEKKDAVKDQLYFPTLRAPLGLDVKIAEDRSDNLAEGSAVRVRAYVEPSADRDELDRLLRSYFRQVKDRGGFLDGAVSKIDIRIYSSAAAAKAGGADWLAAASRTSKKAEERFQNRQQIPLLKWAKKALKPMMPVYTGALKPRILADPKGMSLEVTLPFVEEDGTGQAVKEVSFTRATGAWAGLVMKLFGSIEGLRKLTFVGRHHDEALIKVTLTREQMKLVDLRQVEEQLGAFQGSFMEKLISRKIDHLQVAKKVAKQRKKVYRQVFARLPKEQVFLAKGLMKR